MKIKLNKCLFQTRKNTVDFWMIWKDYEKKVFNQLFKESKEGDTFIDVGANIGRYSVIMAYRGLRVYSFEPIKSNFKLLSLPIVFNKQ